MTGAHRATPRARWPHVELRSSIISCKIKQPVHMPPRAETPPKRFFQKESDRCTGDGVLVVSADWEVFGLVSSAPQLPSLGVAATWRGRGPRWPPEPKTGTLPIGVTLGAEPRRSRRLRQLASSEAVAAAVGRSFGSREQHLRIKLDSTSGHAGAMTGRQCARS